MGFFDFLKSDDENGEELEKWNFLKTSESVQQVIDRSGSKAQVIFKHSPSCAVSFFAKRNLDSAEIMNNSEFDLSTIDVISERALSRELAELTGVRHESPQLLILKNKKVIWHDSHNGVNAENVIKNLTL